MKYRMLLVLRRSVAVFAALSFLDIGIIAAMCQGAASYHGGLAAAVYVFYLPVMFVIVMAVAVVSSAVAIGCFGWSVLVTWWREDWE